MTIRFFSAWESSADLLQRFRANYEIKDSLLKFTNGDDYDHAVVFNRTRDLINEQAKIITVIQEPSWNTIHQPTNFLEHSDYIFIHDKKLFEERYKIQLGGVVIETPAYLFYHDPVDRKFFDYVVSKKKVKKLSMIVSSLNGPNGIYKERLMLLKKILESDLDIDIYGRGLNINDQRYKGSLIYKHKGLLPYEYSIAIENSVEKNLITEKFVDCALCSTIPIYYGAPNISEVYDDRFIRKINLYSDSVIDDIKKIIADPAPLSTVNKAIYFKRFNLYTELKGILLSDKG
jgi:hypothetical protein